MRLPYADALRSSESGSIGEGAVTAREVAGVSHACV